jgi:hypothetical protein
MPSLGSRPTPFDLVFQPAAHASFPTIREALELAGQDPRDRDRFLLQREVVTLLRELRPDEGLGESIDQLAALVHHAYLFWDAGGLTVELPLDRLIERHEETSRLDEPGVRGPAYYAQVPERRIWAQVIPGEPHEPLDGCFVHDLPESDEIRVLGVFGIHPERTGFSVVEVTGSAPGVLEREDGSELFAPKLLGGVAAKLFSIAGEEELLELGWRSHELATGAGTEGFQWKV